MRTMDDFEKAPNPSFKELTRADSTAVTGARKASLSA